jgi:hypothetical protein
MTRAVTKIARIGRAMDLLRTGSALMQMHNGRGVAWYLVPGGEVAENIATALLERADVQPNQDGLFPGISQTFGFRARPRKRMAAFRGAVRTTPSETRASKWRSPMGDEFPETDLDTPTERDLDLAYGSQYLSATDVGDRKIRTKIVKVRNQELRSEDGKTRMRFVLFLEGLDKPMVLNATNKNALVDKLGKTPASWKGASVGLFVDPNVTFAGKRVKGLRLRVLLPPATAAPKPTTKPPTTEPPAAAATAWPEEQGDPGYDPDESDFRAV